MSANGLDRTRGLPAARLREPTVPNKDALLRRRKLELWIAAGLTLVIIAFHVVRLAKAGGLWRDEAATAHLAANFSVRYVVTNSQYELFPLLVPALVHAYSWVVGHGDFWLRVFGMLVGLGIIAALWWNMWAVRRSVPLLSLALLGFNATFIQWSAAIRGYGMGTLFLLLSAGLVWRLVERPTAARTAAAALCAVASVQCLFNSAVLLLALCLGVVVVAIRRGIEKRAVIVAGTGLIAAISLLPYWRPLQAVSEWDMLVRWPVTIESLCSKLGEALSASGWWNTVIWVLSLIAAVVVCFLGQSRRTFNLAREHRDFLLYSGTVLVTAVAGYAAFLKAASVPTQPWYYLVLMGFVALFLDFVIDALRQHHWARITRLSLAVLIAAASFWLTCQQVQVRQTNVDLIAARLRQLADKDDLIVITPWYDGISFNRYYDGPATWVSIPPIEFHHFHRYDLVKGRMTLADQHEVVNPVLDRISETLKAGHRVWIAAPAEFFKPLQADPNLLPAPNNEWGWHDEPYTLIWSARVIAYLQGAARRKGEIQIPVNGRVNPYEDLSLMSFEDGWSP